MSDDGPVSGDAPSWTNGVAKLAVLTGAGISTDSGVPDFRGPNGVWTRNPSAERLATFSVYVTDSSVRRRSWQTRLEHPIWSAAPNDAHKALARVGEVTDTWVITQNIDGLHQRGGSPAERVLELHGTLFDAVCVGCGDRTEMSTALERVRNGEEDPACLHCGGILKSATVMFGQALDPVVLAQAARVAQQCDLMLAIGSTLTVEPAASLCAVAVEFGASLVVINRDPTPYDDIATEVISEPIGVAVPRIAGFLLAQSARS